MDTTRTFISVMCAFSVLTNGTLLIILYLDPLKRFRTTTNRLIISLTISDFITGLSTWLLSFNWGPTAGTTVKIFFLFHWAGVLSSFFTIFFMSCARLVAVTYPLKAKSLITNRRVFSFIASNWLLSSILGGLVVGLELNYFLLVLFFLKLVMILVLVAIYVAIILKMRKKPKLIRDSMNNRRSNIAHEERRLTSILFLLIVILVVTVVPFLLASLVKEGYSIYAKLTPNALVLFIKYYFPVEMLNFVVNPIIYAWRLPSYRKSLLYYINKLPFVHEKSEINSLEQTINDQHSESTVQLRSTRLVT